MSIEITTEVTLVGGVFESPNRIVARGVEDSMTAVGREAQQAARRRLSRVLVNPTGHYESRVDYTVVRGEVAELHDSGVVYGPWLESGGRGTRFRGYSTFRKTRDDVAARADRIADGPVRQMAKELES